MNSLPFASFEAYVLLFSNLSKNFLLLSSQPLRFVGSAKVEAIFDLTKKTFRIFFFPLSWSLAFLRSAPSVCSVWESKIASLCSNYQIFHTLRSPQKVKHQAVQGIGGVRSLHIRSKYP